MKKILVIVRKEFRQIFRNKMMKPILFVMPIMQLAILSYTADYTVKNINIFIQDLDKSSMSQSLINKVDASEYFNLVEVSSSDALGIEHMQSNDVDMIMSIPQNFSKHINNNQHTILSITADAINGTKAGISINYIQNIISDYMQQYSIEQGLINSYAGIEIVKRDWFNPMLNYKYFMVPGILVLLVTMIALFLSGMNIVREKEIGTIEQLNVTPIKKYQFIVGKLLPFLIIGLIEFTIGIVVALLWFNVPFEGSLALMYLFTTIYLSLILGMGMLISTITDTQQQALFLSWFFSVIFILMSGLFTPIESMPAWAQNITLFNPIRYYTEVIRLVMLKGSSFSSISFHFIAISASAVFINVLAMLNYKKTA